MDWTPEKLWFNFQQASFLESLTGIWAQLASFSFGIRSPFLKVKLPGREFYHSSLPVAKVKDERSCNSTPPHNVMARARKIVRVPTLI
jgi:hypothetical protein